MQQPAASSSAGEHNWLRLLMGMVSAVLTLMVTLSPMVRAQTDSASPAVGLPELIEWADTRNPDVISAQAAVATAQRKLEQARRAYSGTLAVNTQLPWQPGDTLNPAAQLSGNLALPWGLSFNGTVSAGKSSKPSTQGTAAAPGADSSRVAGSVSLKLNAWDFLDSVQGKSSQTAQLLQAESDLQKAEQALQQARTQARLKVVQLYWEIQILQEQIGVEQQNLDQLRTTEDRVRKQMESGQATTSDLIKAQLDRFQAENQIQADQQTLQQDMDSLVEATGGKGEYQLKAGLLPDTWSAPSLQLDDLVQQALANSASLKADKAAVKVAQIQLEEAEQQRMPQINLTAETDFGGGKSTQASVLAEADWTLWDAGQTRDKIEELQAALETAQQKLSQDELSLRQSVLTAFNKVQQAERNLQVVSLQRSQAEETARLVDQQAQLGAVTEAKRQEAQRQLRLAELNLASARHNLFLAVAALQNQVGLPVDWAIVGVKP